MSEKKKSSVREIFESFMWAVLLALGVRFFIVEPYKIPSPSMVPTLLVGDHIFVTRYSYGIRVPGTTLWLAQWADPKRGDVIVFTEPFSNDSALFRKSFIKRVVGIPGDKIKVERGRVFVNGEKIEVQDIKISAVNPDDNRELVVSDASLTTLSPDLLPVPFFRGFSNFQLQQEVLGDRKHFIQRHMMIQTQDIPEYVLPDDGFFVMGDNRDQSHDSRFWGHLPRSHLKGEARVIWISVDDDRGGFRWGRFGRKIL